MESDDLLEQEEAYHKLNAEIELRTRQLMKNVEAVINKQTLKQLSPDSLENKNNSCIKVPNKNISSPDLNDSFRTSNYQFDTLDEPFDHYSEQKISGHFIRMGDLKGRNVNKGKELKRNETYDSRLIPQSAKGMSAESLVRFLKAKGKLLQDELEQVKRELQIKNDNFKRIQQEIKIRDDEKQKHLADIGILREKLKKIEDNSGSQAEKLQMRDSENLLLKKEIEMLKQENKRLNITTTGNEARLNKAKEETERLKLLLKQAECNEREAREKYRSTNDEMIAMTRKLEKQKSDLMSAIKKQVVLIDNLKKQKELLEAQRGINYTEKEFLKILEEKYL